MSERGRVGILFTLLFLGTGLLFVRLFSISVLQHNDYVVKAEGQQSVERDILPRRGSIYVQDLASGRNDLVAQSVERFALSATPHNVVHKEEYAHLLAQISGSDENRLQTVFKNSGWYLDPIMHNLTKEQVEDIAVKINELAKQVGEVKGDVKVNFDTSQGDVIYYLGGTYFVREYERTYPEGPVLGQVLGFVNDKGNGQYGFEGQYDSELKGYAGKLLLEQDSRGTLLNQTDAVQGKDGTNYVLSVDRNIQYVVEQELAKQVQDTEAKSGSVIIMNPKTGEITAMASYPSYDPNNFRDVAKNNGISLFDNPTISSIWEPGSIFKPLVMAAALDTGTVTPDTTGDFPASVTVDGYQINTALNKAFGHETMTQVLVNSDNVAMVWVAQKLGNQNMYNYLHQFGFGSLTGVDLKNEIAGKVLPLNQWHDIQRSTMSFGQGIGVTPMQIVTAFSAIANNGRMVQPRIVHSVVDANGNEQLVKTTEGEQIIKPETAAELRDMLVSVVVNNHKKAGVDGYKIGGKTGTAQVPDPVNGGYLPDAYNHSFVGMGPSDDPKFVMLIKIDQPNLQKVGQFAESTAVPLFGRIAQFLLHYYQIQPTNK